MPGRKERLSVMVAEMGAVAAAVAAVALCAAEAALSINE